MHRIIHFGDGKQLQDGFDDAVRKYVPGAEDACAFHNMFIRALRPQVRDELFAQHVFDARTRLIQRIAPLTTIEGQTFISAGISAVWLVVLNCSADKELPLEDGAIIVPPGDMICTKDTTITLDGDAIPCACFIFQSPDPDGHPDDPACYYQRCPGQPAGPGVQDARFQVKLRDLMDTGELDQSDREMCDFIVHNDPQEWSNNHVDPTEDLPNISPPSPSPDYPPYTREEMADLMNYSLD